MKTHVSLLAASILLLSSCSSSTGIKPNKKNKPGQSINYTTKIVYKNSKHQSVYPVAFSPNGTHILLQVLNWDGSVHPAIINRDGSGFRELIDKDKPLIRQIIGYSPDGSKILYKMEDIFAVDTAAGSKPVRLINEEGIGIVDPVVFSPDGQLLLYNFVGKKGGRVFIANADGSNPRQITHSPSTATGFSPDGIKILFHRNNNQRSDIWIMDTDGQNKVNLTPGKDEWGLPVAFMSNGRILYRHKGIRIMDEDGSDKVIVSDNPDYVPTGASPDGDIIAFYKRVPVHGIIPYGAGKIGLIRSDGTDSTFFDNAHLVADFSPNGRYVLFGSSEGKGNNWQVKVAELK